MAALAMIGLDITAWNDLQFLLASETVTDSWSSPRLICGALGTPGGATSSGEPYNEPILHSLPFQMTVSGNKNGSKQGEFSVFIAAIEKIM